MRFHTTGITHPLTHGVSLRLKHRGRKDVDGRAHQHVVLLRLHRKVAQAGSDRVVVIDYINGIVGIAVRVSHPLRTDHELVSQIASEHSLG